MKIEITITSPGVCKTCSTWLYQFDGCGCYSYCRKIKNSFPSFHFRENPHPFKILFNDDCSQLQKSCVPEWRNFFRIVTLTNEVVQQNSSLIKLNFYFYYRSYCAVVIGCGIYILPQCGATNKEIDNSSANIFHHHRRCRIRVL